MPEAAKKLDDEEMDDEKRIEELSQEGRDPRTMCDFTLKCVLGLLYYPLIERRPDAKLNPGFALNLQKLEEEWERRIAPFREERNKGKAICEGIVAAY